jgi:hypothetical protein
LLSLSTTIVHIDLKGQQPLGVTEAVKQYLTNIRRDIIKDLRGKKISNGDLGMEIQLAQTGGGLSANDYIYQLWKGRKPGTMPPIESILSWIKKKHIKPLYKIKPKSLAFLIARKIGRQGTDIFMGKRPGLDLEAIIEINTEEFIAKLQKMDHDALADQIGKALKKVF